MLIEFYIHHLPQLEVYRMYEKPLQSCMVFFLLPRNLFVIWFKSWELLFYLNPESQLCFVTHSSVLPVLRYWLYAAVKLKCLLVTNDEMRDHIFELLGSSFFLQWKERHQVCILLFLLFCYWMPLMLWAYDTSIRCGSFPFFLCFVSFNWCSPCWSIDHPQQCIGMWIY